MENIKEQLTKNIWTNVDIKNCPNVYNEYGNVMAQRIIELTIIRFNEVILLISIIVIFLTII